MILQKRNVRYLDTRGVYNGNRFITFTTNEDWDLCSSPKNEDRPLDLDEEHKGGVITLSTDDETPGNVPAVCKIKQVLGTCLAPGWTIGHFLNGRFRDHETGKLFSRESLSVELTGITTDALFDLSEELCIKLRQQSVLVKDYNSHEILFIGTDKKC